MLQAARRALSTIGQSYAYLFLFGVCGGIGFEMFKTHFTINGHNFYTTFRRNQLQRELHNYEKQLISTENELKQLIQQRKAALAATTISS